MSLRVIGHRKSGSSGTAACIAGGQSLVCGVKFQTLGDWSTRLREPISAKALGPFEVAAPLTATDPAALSLEGVPSPCRRGVALLHLFGPRPLTGDQKQEPGIVHFSGHGAAEGALLFEDRDGNATVTDPAAIAELFRLAGENTRLIVLNACYTEPQARALAQHVDAVVGMSDAVSDDSAIAFSKALYEALGEGRDVQRAFELARNYVKLQGLPGTELPTLVVRPGVPGASVRLLAAR